MPFRILLSLAITFAIEADQTFAQSPPERPKPPAVKNRDWIRIPLDAFVLHRLEAEGREPAPVAGREELLRRLTPVLAGRDATKQEIDAFVASRDKRAYEKEVDRLLESPGFAERFAEVARLKKKDHPSTARAAANLAWRKFFGRPLVSDDGSGHPDALEWLACELLDPTLINCCDLDRPLPEAWDIKHLAKAIVVSAVYRQTR